MVLVLIFLGLFIILLLLASILLLSTVKITIEHLEMENILSPKVSYDYCIQIGLYFLGKVPFFKIRVNKSTIKKLKLMERLKKANIEKDVVLDFNILKKLKLLAPKIEAFDLNLKLGTEDALYTSVLVFIISMIFSLGLPHLVEKKNVKEIKYEITPYYVGKNLFSIELNHSIIYVKMVHIINIIYIYLQRRREVKHERTSNRRSYANCHEQYSRYGRCKYHYRGTN